MGKAAFLARRLPPSGCIVAGTKLAAHREALKSKKLKLSAKVETSIQSVLAATEALQALGSTDATMTEIDRGTDRCIGAFGSVLDSIVRAFDHEGIVPLSDEEAARRADAELVRSEVLSSGTDFLRLVHSQQWVRMSALVKALDRKEVNAAVERLGLSAEVGRLRRWTELYGRKLGVTEARGADPAVKAIEAWHEAYGALMVHVHAEYDDDRDETHVLLRDRLLSPYEDAAEEERRAHQRARAAAKKRNDEVEAAPEPI
ncbi:phosphoenolpyruvate--protein phosphotransferase [Sorangium cellulosum]|uniref:Phosphoenolpyruvate--protein phosphotransferase n=1 Tax=Sorangium cellulosum TaxID=56 RepID=A0A150R0F6_SORCE|nr:phosphoenolpyruvate--protein phosphotransferase [Sorangium cellulosum]